MAIPFSTNVDDIEPHHRLLFDEFLHRAESHPDKISIAFADSSFNYGELRDAAQGFADHLREHGVRPGDRITLTARRTPHLVVAVLGGMIAAATIALVDASYPPARVHAMVSACSPRFGVEVRGAAPHIVAMDLSDRGGLEPRCGEPSQGYPEHAYLGYTSGSTGAPKLVRGPHAALVHFVDWYRQLLRITDPINTALISGLSHDPLWREIFLPLSSGGAIHIPPPSTWPNPSKLAAWVSSREITDFCLTPSMARRILATTGRQLSNVRRVVLSGEDVCWEDLKRFRVAAPCAQFIAGYGATETPQIAMFSILDPSTPIERSGQVPLGIPAPGFEISLAEPANPRMSGALRELVVKSEFLAHGYFGQSSSAFQQDGQTWEYRTGDLVERVNGALYFRGRLDRRLKVRGVRIEAEEIERALTGVEGVQAAAVFVAPPRHGRTKDLLVAALSVFQRAPSLREVRTALSKLLPVGALPDDVIVLCGFPTTANGKIDMGELQRQYNFSEASSALAALFERVLERVDVEPDDDFFELEGDSLAAIELTVLIEEQFGCEMSLEDVFSAPTVNELTRVIVDRAGDA